MCSTETVASVTTGSRFCNILHSKESIASRYEEARRNVYISLERLEDTLTILRCAVSSTTFMVLVVVLALVHCAPISE